MNRFNFLRSSLGAALILGASQTSLSAADAPHPCALVRESSERLACYDAAFGKPAQEAARSPDKLFGLTAAQVERAAGGKTRAEAIDSVTSPISALERLRDGYFVVTLVNGQVWRQSELNSRADVQVGDAITVRRAALGSYLLVTKAGIGTRVKRVR